MCGEETQLNLTEIVVWAGATSAAANLQFYSIIGELCESGQLRLAGLLLVVEAARCGGAGHISMENGRAGICASQCDAEMRGFFRLTGQKGRVKKLGDRVILHGSAECQ